MEENSTPFNKHPHPSGNESLISETVAFLVQTRQWWLAPILFALLVLGLFLALAGSSAAPLIYTLF